jgi:hypothetical protein
LKKAAAVTDMPTTDREEVEYRQKASLGLPRRAWMTNPRAVSWADMDRARGTSRPSRCTPNTSRGRVSRTWATGGASEGTCKRK